MKLEDVFTPVGLPSVTYIDEHLKGHREQLTNSLGTYVISISGPSKSGKTVFVENIVGADNLLLIVGSGIDDPQQLWMRIFDKIGLPTEVKKTTEIAASGEVHASASAEAGLVLAKGKTEGGAKAGISGRISETSSKPQDYMQTLIRELQGTPYVIFIDDFHYIDKEAQAKIAEQIKEIVRNKMRVVCASVPYHSDDVVRANPDLRGRICAIDFNYWSEEDLAKIAKKGFTELNIVWSTDLIARFTAECAGSPQLMQALCQNACLKAKIRETAKDPFSLPNTDEFFRDVCAYTASVTPYKSVVDKMKEGPKTRGTERKTYEMMEGMPLDVYPLILKAIAADPPQLTFRYDDLQARIGEVCAEKPSGSSIIGTCGHISSIANEGASGECIVEWDGPNCVLDIRDPYLLFYLRWKEFYVHV